MEVFFNGEAWEHVVVLGDKPHPFSNKLVGFETGDFITLEENAALAHVHLSEDGLEQSRFTGTVGADDADQFTFVGNKVAAIENVHPGQITGVNVFDLDDGGVIGHYLPPFPDSSPCNSSNSAAAAAALSPSMRPVTTPRSTSWWLPR